MFTTANGGIEQVFLSYNRALEQQGNEVVPVIHSWSQIKKNCLKNNLKTVFSYGRKDVLAVYRLRKFLEKEKPSCIITHTKRDTFLFSKTKTRIPIIAVCHTLESFCYLQNLSDAVITITTNMSEEVHRLGWNTKKVFTLPNMVHIFDELQYKEPVYKDVPVIGASARFSDLKGLDVFINALALLKNKGILFRAKIAGDGKQKKEYWKLIKQLNLHDEVHLLGWVDDKQSFYESLDIFCHPSLKESFGLVIVESMMNSVPMVITAISGPLEIIGESECALLVPPSDPERLAAALEQLISNFNLAKELSYKGFLRAKSFSSRAVSPLLNKIVYEVCQSF